jgi:hypothetical protein
MSIRQQLEETLCRENPIESMRMLAIQLNKSGINKEDILKEFVLFDDFLKKSNRCRDANFLEDVIDMLTGYYVGRNLELD